VIVDIGHDHELVGICVSAMSASMPLNESYRGEPTMERASMPIAWAFFPQAEPS